MNWNLAYLALNALVIPAWLLLLFQPRSDLTRRAVHSFAYPFVIGAIYLVSLIAAVFFGLSKEGAGFSSIEAVAAIFDHPNGVITGWSHYVVFDLFVGAWIARDAARRGIAHLPTVPCLLGTYVFGPSGLLLYGLLRLLRGQPISLEETGNSGDVRKKRPAHL